MTTLFMSSALSRKIAFGAVSLGILLVAALAFAETTTTYTYDALGRLRTVTKTGDLGGAETYDYDAAGNRTQVTSVAAPPPTTPGNFRATSVTTGGVTLAWDASTAAFGISWYRIARSSSGTVMGNGNASTTYVDGTVSLGTTYTYQIFAVDGHGVESAPASVTVSWSASTGTAD